MLVPVPPCSTSNTVNVVNVLFASANTSFELDKVVFVYRDIRFEFIKRNNGRNPWD